MVPGDSAAQLRVLDAHQRFTKSKPSDVARKSFTYDGEGISAVPTADGWTRSIL
jgi:hypothetical protein